MNRLRVAAWLAVPLLSGALPLFAHGGAEQQIAALSARLEKAPRDAGLHLRRGELHRTAGHRQAALADFARAEALDPNLPGVHLARGLLFLAEDQPDAAQQALDRFLAHRPDHVEGLVARARAWMRLGEPRAAADDYSRALAGRPDPGVYVERGRAALGPGGPGPEAALKGLDEGIARLGPLVALEIPAIDLEVQLGRYDAALTRLDRIAAQSARQDRWLVRRGEILARAGREAESRAALARALAAIEGLPAHRRAAPATLALEAQVRAALAPEGTP